MIMCDHGKGYIHGNMAECLAEFGILVKHLILSVPEDHRLMIMEELGNQMKLGIELAMKGGEKNEKSQ